MKNKVLYPLYLSLAVILGIALGSTLNFPHQTIAFNHESEREQKLRQIINYIDYEYVDQVNTDSLLDQTISELLHHLDPHSTYIPEEEVLASEESIRGSFAGIGIEFKIYQDTLTVVKILEGGPSEAAGLMPGDRILRADTTLLHGEGLNPTLVLSTLKGVEGTAVDLEILNPATKKTRRKRVTRGQVGLNSVSSAFMLNDSVGMIKLTKFTARSAEETEQAIADLKKQGAQKLILDLRDNPGGLMSAAEKIADQFLPKDALIVFTKDREDRKQEFKASRRGLFEQGDLVILQNRGSASASEIVAGAIQDNQRGAIVGRRSFGKGLVQEEITLRDGSKMRLTTQRYFTPSGRSIQRDYDTYDENLYFHNFSTSTNEDSVLLPEGEELKKRSNQGGILPDLEVGYDTTGSTRLLYQLAMTANLDDKAFEYVDRRRQAFREMSAQDFINNWQVDSTVHEHFFGAQIAAAIPEQPQEQQVVLNNRLKAFIAYNLYGNIAYQQVYSWDDPYVNSALEAFKLKLWNTAD